MVIPMSRTPGSDDYNGDRMIVKMILIAVMVRPMSRTPGGDQKIGDTQVDQVEVDCRSHVPATESSTSTSSTTLSASSSSSANLLRTTERMTRIFPMPAKQTRTTTADNRARAWKCGDCEDDRASSSDIMLSKNQIYTTATFGYCTFKYTINCVVLLCWQKN